MSTATLTVNAPSQATRENFLVGLKNKAVRTARSAGGWVREMSDRSGLTRVVGTMRRYLTKVWSFASTIIRAAGAIPLTLLAVSSRTGQKTIKSTVGFLWGIGSWVGRKLTDALDRIARLFGKPGNALADRGEKALGKTQAFLRTNLKKFAAVAAPYISPERTHMKAIKVVSYGMVVAGLVSTFVSGVWVIPAYLAAAVAGAMMSPTIRRNVLVNRIIGAFESDAKATARKTVAEAMEAMVVEYGPEMDSWSQAAKADYAVKQAIYNALDGVDDPFKGLSGNQRKKAEKWLREFEAGVNRIVDETVAAAEGEVKVDNTGHVVVEGAVA